MPNNRRRSQYPFGLTGCQFTAVVIGLAILAAIGFGGYGVYQVIKRYIGPTPPAVTEKKKRPGPSPRRTGPLAIEEARALYLSLGNPSNATESASNANNYLMVKPEYALSYSRERGGPNWVAWHVTASDLGDVKRKDDFRPDSSLPSGWLRITPSDYTRSGYDKGHICPSADRTSDPETNSATFLMTNMIPQTGDNNRGPWKLLEDYCRDLVENGNDVFIIAGAYGEKERLKGKVSVPTNTWKVVVVVPQGAISADDVTNDARVIAINIPNDIGIKDDNWRKYKTTVRAIEQTTGLDLLNKVRSDVQNVIENRLDNK